MKLEMHLKVDAQSFFDCLVESIVYDINTSSNKQVKPKDLKVGFTYKKKMKTKTKAMADVKVKFTEFEPPFRYAAEFKAKEDITTSSYVISPADDGGIDIVYCEGYESKSQFSSWNYKLVSMIYNFKAKKRMKRTLKSMESYILNTPKETTEE